MAAYNGSLPEASLQGLNFQIQKTKMLRIGSDRFPLFLEQLRSDFVKLLRSPRGSKACVCYLARACPFKATGRKCAVSGYLCGPCMICRCFGWRRCCCWLSLTFKIMFVHLQQRRYPRRHLGRVSCLVGDIGVSVAVDGHSGEVCAVCRRRTVALACVYGVWQGRGLEHSSSCLLQWHLPKCTANSGSRCKATRGHEPRAFLCFCPEGLRVVKAWWVGQVRSIRV